MFSTNSIVFLLIACLFMSINILGQGTGFNICQWITCSNGGLCQKAPDTTAGYLCRCQFGFSGLLCDDRVNITTCVTNPCQNNGNCTINSNRQVVCNCRSPFTGFRCENVVANSTG